MPWSMLLIHWASELGTRYISSFSLWFAEDQRKLFNIVRFIKNLKVLNEMFMEKLIFLIFMPTYLQLKGKFNHSFSSIFG